MNENFNFVSSDMVHVNSYTRSNGTFVDEYWRKRPDGSDRIISEQDTGIQWDKILEIFPNLEAYDKYRVLKKIFTQNQNTPPIFPEPDESGPRTVYNPEYKNGPVMSFGIAEGAGELLKTAFNAVREATVKAGEIATEAAKKAGEVIANTATDVGNIMADAPKDLILDTSREVLQGGVSMDVIQPAIETVKSGVLDTLKEALSKIDTDETAAILTKAVKEFGEIAQKYPELANAYDKLQSMRVNATLYRSLERQKIFDAAKEAKNNALVAAKDFGNEIKQLSSSKFSAIEKESRTNPITPRYSGSLASTPMYISAGNSDLSNYGYKNPWTENVFMPQTKTDLKTLWNTIKVAPQAMKQKQIIDDMLNKFVETENVPENLRNSLRHRGGSALMSNMNGPDVARVYGNFKEISDLAVLKENDSLFDLSNNELGRRLQTQTPYLTNEELLKLVYEDIKKHPLPPDNYKDRWLMELYWHLLYLWNDFGYTRWHNFQQFQRDVIDFIRLRLKQQNSSG